MQENQNNIIKTAQLFFLNNLKYILILSITTLSIFIIFQIYNYFQIKELKKTSIEFFNSIEDNDSFVKMIESQKNKNIYSLLSNLKIIQKNNIENKFMDSNKIYKDIISSYELDNLYLSSISAHAAYTLINATYYENTNKYLKDILIYIDKISDDLESYYSIKNELIYLLQVAEIDINKEEYKNNTNVLQVYTNIINSDLISSQIKERVKKIHEFQLYK